MTMIVTDEVAIVSLGERDRWIDEHRKGGLPTQSWGYAWGLSASGIDPKLAIIRARGSRMLLPFFERSWMGSTDIATIVGASGASIVGNASAPLALWREFSTAQGWVAGYIQLSTSVDLKQSDLEGELVTTTVTHIIDVRADNPEKSMSHNIRRKIRKATQWNAVLFDDDAVLSAALKRLYPLMMQRLGALPHFCYSSETIDRWTLDPASLLLGASIENSVEAVILFIVGGDHAIGHITGSSVRGRELLPWLICNATTHLLERGARTLDLGSGLRQGDGLHRFKERFNGVATSRHAVSQIYDQRKYDTLCRNAGRSSPDVWFPAYRTPSEP